MAMQQKQQLSEELWQDIANELQILWQLHERVGLEHGVMALYTINTTDPWRAEEMGYVHWFDRSEEQIIGAVAEIKRLYNEGNLPNTPLLLNPIVYNQPAGEAIGSGFAWGSALCKGINNLTDEQIWRVQNLKIDFGYFIRGDNDQAGLKMIAVADEILPPSDVEEEVYGNQVVGCHELCDVINMAGEEYWPYYLLSGLSYLSKNGSFKAQQFTEIIADISSAKNQPIQNILDANECWNAYDRHHALYERFGTNPADIEWNLRFYHLCARDFELFSATGPMREDAKEHMDFIVPGYVPRGSITLLAGSAGTGKSSVAHHLCVLSAMEFAENEQDKKDKLTWLGQKVNLGYCDGISVYFAGEDSPAIINARMSLFDPESRAERMMYHRTDFGLDDQGEALSFAQFLRKLKKMPSVPIMVIDPARKYLTGDEDDAGVVSEFFEAIEEFAIEKGTAMVVVHHLSKGADPKSAREVLDCLRGSQVFIDRPRVVLGLYRDGPYTVIGVAKSNIPPNMGMVQQERVFARDPKSLELVWLPGDAGVRSDVISEEELEQIKAEREMQEHMDKNK